MADWAGREIVAEKQAEAATAQFERQKELALMQDELAGKREERSAELKEKFASKAEASKKESRAAAFESLDWAATRDPDGPKLKAGTPDYYRFMGEKLDASGEADLAKQMFANADKFDDNDIKRKQIDAQLSNAAATRFAASEGRAATNDLRRSEFEFTKDKDYRASLNQLGTFKSKNKESGEDVVNYDGLSVVTQADRYLETDLGIKDRTDRYNALAKIRSDADAWRAKHPTVSFMDSMRMSADQYINDSKKKTSAKK
jgi:hypothetical protein